VCGKLIGISSARRQAELVICVGVPLVMTLFLINIRHWYFWPFVYAILHFLISAMFGFFELNFPSRLVSYDTHLT
jgi:hypothetical protein